MKSRGCVSVGEQAARAQFLGIWIARMGGTSGASRRRAIAARRAPPQRTRRPPQLRFPRAQVVLPDRRVAAPLRQRLQSLLRFRAGEAGGIASGLDAEALSPLGAAADGESVSARSLARLATRPQPAGGRVLPPAIVRQSL